MHANLGITGNHGIIVVSLTLRVGIETGITETEIITVMLVNPLLCVVSIAED
jgi:hypothetical protein